jgi:signal transduction histidine kinase
MFVEFEDANKKMDLYVQQSIASAFTLTNLINDLLDLAKMETASFKIATE